MGSWKDILEFYKEKFGLKESYVNFVADQEILQACLSGLSNISIANAFHMHDEDASATIEAYFGFGGFSRDLDINPYMLYNVFRDRGYSKKSFNRELRLLSKELTNNKIDIYSCCEKLKRLEDKIKEIWK